MQDFGLIGLAVMGRNLALNIERNGFSVSVYNQSPERTRSLMREEGAGKKLVPFEDLAEFVKSIRQPRRIIVMIKAGAPVDEMLTKLLPLVAKGDILIDAGNSLFTDTARRFAGLEPQGIHYVGMGVSGGEEGALWGPSIMPGGEKSAVAALEPVLTKIAAKVDSGPCVAYMGKGGAGHFVKMVHNGIEYGDMQLISEAYEIMKTGMRLSNKEMADVFSEWNKGALKSYLIEITAEVLRYSEEDGGELVDKILDKAGQKGTGKWTITAALDEGVAIPTISAAVDGRLLSAAKDERVRAAKVYAGLAKPKAFKPDAGFTAKIAHALYASKICSYAQGFALLGAADKHWNFGLNPAEIARIWKGGCIIRAVFLDRIRQSYQRNPALANLLVDPDFVKDITASYDAWREVVVFAQVSRIAVPAMAASLAYFNAYTTDRLPANLIQAQRDYFGAHTYERTDREGIFHTEWTKKNAHK